MFSSFFGESEAGGNWVGLDQVGWPRRGTLAGGRRWGDLQ